MLDNRLLTFLTLCQELNYTRTGKLLHMSQPAVSQHIRYLEDYYGVKLFSYQKKTLSLTPQGERLYEYSLALRASADKIKSIVHKKSQLSLNFGTTLSVAGYFMEKPLKKLLEDYPQAEIFMDVNNTQILLSRLREGQLDFVILEGHFDKSKYSYKLLSKENFIGIASSIHPLAKSSVQLRDLLGQRLIVRERGSGTRDIFEKILYEENLTMSSFKNTLEIGNIEAIKSLVRSGLGISFLYELTVKKELGKSLTRLQIEGFQIAREINFVYLKNNPLEEELLAFLSYFNH